MCTVPLSEDTQRRVELWSNAILKNLKLNVRKRIEYIDKIPVSYCTNLYISARSTPLRNSFNNLPDEVSKTLISVP